MRGRYRKFSHRCRCYPDLVDAGELGGTGHGCARGPGRRKCGGERQRGAWHHRSHCRSNTATTTAASTGTATIAGQPRASTSSASSAPLSLRRCARRDSLGKGSAMHGGSNRQRDQTRSPVLACGSRTSVLVHGLPHLEACPCPVRKPVIRSLATAQRRSEPGREGGRVAARPGRAEASCVAGWWPAAAVVEARWRRGRDLEAALAVAPPGGGRVERQLAVRPGDGRTATSSWSPVRGARRQLVRLLLHRHS